MPSSGAAVSGLLRGGGCEQSIAPEAVGWTSCPVHSSGAAVSGLLRGGGCEQGSAPAAVGWTWPAVAGRAFASPFEPDTCSVVGKEGVHLV